MKIVALILLVAIAVLIYFNSNLVEKPFVSKSTPLTQDFRLFIDRNSAPNIVWTTNQQLTKLSSFAGRVIYLNFWAQWCEPCKTELPILQKLQAEFPTVQFILVNLDDPDDLEKAKAFANELAPDLMSVYDKQAFTSKLNIQVLPYHLLIDKNGLVAGEFYGDLIGKEDFITKQLHQLVTETVN